MTSYYLDLFDDSKIYPTLESINSYFRGLEDGVLATAIWKDGIQYTAMGRSAKDVVCEIRDAKQFRLDYERGV